MGSSSSSLRSLLIVSLIITSVFALNRRVSEEEFWDPYSGVETIQSNDMQGEAFDYLFIDPDENLEDSEIEDINDRLSELNDLGVHTFFILINGLLPDYNYSRNGLNLFIDEFIYYFLKAYEVSFDKKIKEDDVLIIIYSLEEERSAFRTGENVSKNLSKDEYNLIQTHQISKFRTGKYHDAFTGLLDETIKYMDQCHDCVSFWVGIGFFIFAGVIIATLLIIQGIICIRGKQISDGEKDKVEKMNTFLNKYRENRDVLDSTCIGCLENTHEIQTDSHRPSNNPQDEQNPVILNNIHKGSCGHRYHQKCYDDWVGVDDDTCPLCIEKIEKDGEIDKLQRRGIMVQSKIHKVFNEGVFTLKGNGLTYKFSNDFHNGDLTNLN